MSFKGTNFFCVDNTGVRRVKCIYVYGRKTVLPGSIILVTIKDVLPNRKVSKGQLYKAVVVRLNCNILRWSGVSVRYYENNVVILKKNEMVPMGTRIFGSVYFELRLKGFMKVVSLSPFLI